MSSLQEHIDRSLRARECVCSSGILGFRIHRDGCPMADTEPRGRWYVNVYERGQRYGGPEEGGWWYDTGCFVPEKSGLLTDVTEKEAHQAARDLWSDLDEEAIEDNLPPVHSVMYRGGRYTVRAEEQPGRDFPAETPHYE